MKREQWAGAIFSLTVVLPAAILADQGNPQLLLSLRYSPWVLIPVIGGFISGFVIRGRPSLAIFAALAGYSGFWSAATWGAGSRATSLLETLAATGVGVLPCLLMYVIYSRLTRTENDIRTID